MIYYSQRDIRWAGLKLGTCSITIGQAGCFVASLAMLDGRTPNIVNDILRDNSGFSGGCNLLSDRAAGLLELEYGGKVYSNPGRVCIAETDHYRNSGYPQHFFVLFPDGTINCPILGERIVNPYRMVSYRLFKEKNVFSEDMGVIEDLQKQLRETVDLLAERTGALNKALDDLQAAFVEINKSHQKIHQLEVEIANLKALPPVEIIKEVEPTWLTPIREWLKKFLGG